MSYSVAADSIIQRRLEILSSTTQTESKVPAVIGTLWWSGQLLQQVFSAEMSWRLRRVVEDVAFNNFHNNFGWKLKEV